MFRIAQHKAIIKPRSNTCKRVQYRCTNSENENALHTYYANIVHVMKVHELLLSVLN